MQIGMVGLGRMGMNMARRLIKGQHDVVVYNRTKEKVVAVEKEGARGAATFEELLPCLKPPRVVWMMLPAGYAVDEHVKLFADMLAPRDILVDGGNSYYKDDLRHAEELRQRGIHYVDAGVAGGIWGLEAGYCIMLGGEEADVNHLQPLLETLAPREGFLYCGPTGAGHFVKMVHNGIEYALMEAYGEGFKILQSSPYGADLNLEQVAHLWNQGSVVRSWLLELLEKAFSRDPVLSSIKGYVEDSGEGRWTVQQALETGVSVPVIALALLQRFRSREQDSFSDKVVAALRREFGGHAVVTTQEKK